MKSEEHSSSNTLAKRGLNRRLVVYNNSFQWRLYRLCSSFKTAKHIFIMLIQLEWEGMWENIVHAFVCLYNENVSD